MQYKNYRSKQIGAGLPEILVAMLLLGVAVIGFAGLQVRALDSSTEAMSRTQAMSIAQDLAERMRLNPNAAGNYRSNWSGWASDVVALDKCETNTCTPTEMAQYDKVTLTNIAANSLPNGTVNIVACPSRTNLCVYVAWNTTTATQGDAAPNCANSAGLYVTNADCVILETNTL